MTLEQRARRAASRIRSRLRAGDQVAATPERPPETPARRRTFLLGVGAQKAGTTWLYAYLKKSKRFVHGYRKEYHVFDSRDVATEEWMRRRIARFAEAEAQKVSEGEAADAEQLHRLSMVADADIYYDYFKALMHRRPRFHVAADVTPDYALLPQETFVEIQRGFAQRDIHTVTAFLMRDPVERIYSQIRMQQGRRPNRFPKPAEEMVAELYDSERWEIRTRYEHTLRNVEATFAPEDVYYGFYEELFSVEEVHKITDLVGIPFHDPDFDERRNVSQQKRDGGLPPDVVRRVAQHYSATYDAVAERFPDKDLAAIWPSARYVR